MENAIAEPTPCSASLFLQPDPFGIVARIASALASVAQAEVVTEHLFHAGMYARTVHLIPDLIVTGVVVKIPTLVIVSGTLDVLVGEEWVSISGYGVLPGSAGRQQAYRTRGPVSLTMIFPTQAKDVESAEREFTDQFESLMSRNSHSDIVTMTGE